MATPQTRARSPWAFDHRIRSRFSVRSTGPDTLVPEGGTIVRSPDTTAAPPESATLGFGRKIGKARGVPGVDEPDASRVAAAEMAAPRLAHCGVLRLA